MGKINNLVASLLFLGSVYANQETSNPLDVERASDARTINELVIERNLGEKFVEEDELKKITLVRFLYENKGYVITSVDIKEENEKNGNDFIDIKRYSIQNNIQRYIRIVDEKFSGKPKIGFEMFYIAKPDEKVLPEKESDRPIIERSRIIQTRSYPGENDKQNEEIFQAEYDDLILEIIDFYEEE